MKKSYQCCDVPSHANASKCRIQKKSKVNKRLNTQHTIPSLLLPRNFLYFCEFSSRRDFFAMLCSGYSIDLNYTVTYNIELKLITVQAVFCITCILPIFLYGSEIWCLTSTLEKKIDALDNWCLRRILHIHWTDFVSNDVVRSHTGQPLLSDTISQRRLSFFGHLCRADTGQDHSLSSTGLHSGSSQRLAMKNWKTEANLVENGWGWSAPAQLRPGDGKMARYG